MVIDTPAVNKRDDEGGVGAYLNAIKGRDAVQRGRGGRLKFSNKRGNDDDDDEMDVDEDDVKVVKQHIRGNARDAFKGGRGRGRGGHRGGKGGISNGRRGL